MRMLRILVAAAALSLLAAPALTYADGSPACKEKCKQAEHCKGKCPGGEQCKEKCKQTDQCKGKCLGGEQCKEKCKQAEHCKQKHANDGCKQDLAKCPMNVQK